MKEASAAKVVPVLEIKNIKKRFGDKEILKGASFALNRGDIKAIIGPSGGGKSTLLHCFCRPKLITTNHYNYLTCKPR